MKRVDNTNYLYHWVKSEPHTNNQQIDFENAYETFINILMNGYLKHGDTYKTNGAMCICFTESPEYFMHRDKSKYQPFGFKFLKREIFSIGGRAVIYAPEYEKNFIHESMVWRYMRHDPLARDKKTPYGVDFTWEREWRLPKDKISILDAISIIVPNEEFVARIYDETEQWLKKNMDEMGSCYGYYAPDPGFVQHVNDIREALITPEEFE